MTYNHGSQRLTADGVVGPSGKPIRVFNVTWLSGAGGPGELVLENGTAASSTNWIVQDGSAASKSDTLNFEGGLLFADGCYFDKDANVAAIVVEYRVEV